MGVLPISVPKPLAYAIDTAGDKSDVDFNYLLQTAARESSLNPTAKASTSSATGLFQFLDSTWLQVMKQEGPRLGYTKYAEAIQVDSDGDYYIADKALKKEVLKLREDPQIAADLAAAFTRSNGEFLFNRFGRMPSPGELYIAHFLGAQGAEKLFTAGLADPDQSAAALFPRQAKANPTIFYENGKARSIREVYESLVSKHEAPAPGASAADAVLAAEAAANATVNGEADVPIDANFFTQQVAGGKWPDAAPLPSRFGPADMSFTQLFSNEGEVQGRVLMSPGSEAQGSALFTQFYGQPGKPPGS